MFCIDDEQSPVCSTGYKIFVDLCRQFLNRFGDFLLTI